MRRAVPLVDRFGRRPRKLRISVTDRCDFRCAYCMPEEPVWFERDEVLRPAEIERLARVFVRRAGIRAIRLTGGEPLVRPEIVEIVERLVGVRRVGLERLSLTTNGSRLALLARPLREAGLDDLNVSLDSLDADRFFEMTRGRLDAVLSGIEAARAAGFPVKINTVLIRGRNDDEIVPLVEWAIERGIELRFIEFMPLDGRGRWRRDDVVTEKDVVDALSSRFSVEPVERDGADPAARWLVDGRHPVGVIPTVSNPFCGACDRVRVNARGEMMTCLFATSGVGLRDLVRAKASNAAIADVIRGAVRRKEPGFVAWTSRAKDEPAMNAIGG